MGLSSSSGSNKTRSQTNQWRTQGCVIKYHKPTGRQWVSSATLNLGNGKAVLKHLQSKQLYKPGYHTCLSRFVVRFFNKQGRTGTLSLEKFGTSAFKIRKMIPKDSESFPRFFANGLDLLCPAIPMVPPQRTGIEMSGRSASWLPELGDTSSNKLKVNELDGSIVHSICSQVER